jgi:hypothetical protein
MIEQFRYGRASGGLITVNLLPQPQADLFRAGTLRRSALSATKHILKTQNDSKNQHENATFDWPVWVNAEESRTINRRPGVLFIAFLHA